MIFESVVSSTPVKRVIWALSVLAALMLGTAWLAGCTSAGSRDASDDRVPLTATFKPNRSLPKLTSLLPVPSTKDSDFGQDLNEIESTALPSTAETLSGTIMTATLMPTEPSASPLPPTRLHHTIEPGETLLGLAVDNGVSMASIQLANGMGDSIDLIAGQTILIPSDTQWLGENRFWIIHIVKQGQTLIGLATDYGLTVEQILRVNAIADPDLIHPDQQLIVPLNQLVTLRAPQPTAIPATGVASTTHKTNPIVDSSNATPTTPSEGASTAVAAVPTAPNSAPSLPAGPADWSSYILARINAVRSEHGLNTLALAPQLTSAAQAHAEDCAQRGWGSHVGSDGAVLKTRLERAGYSGRNSGENWVQALNAERAFDWWYGEIPPNDPHRRNILSRFYAEIGIGIAKTRWGYIFVTDFGRR